MQAELALVVKTVESYAPPLEPVTEPAVEPVAKEPVAKKPAVSTPPVVETPVVVAPPNLDTASAWARDAITGAVNAGYVPTEIQNKYTNVITRAQFCRMAVMWVEHTTSKDIDSVMAEKGVSRDPNAFTDTKDNYILAAYALGITNGTGNNKFTPDGQFTREQAATMIRNTCKTIGVDVDNAKDQGFVDISAASSWAVDSINFCRANGIMNGTGTTILTFSPKVAYTIEQSIQTFFNIAPDKLPKIKSTALVTKEIQIL